MDDSCQANRCCNNKNPSYLIYYGKAVCYKFWFKWGNRPGAEIRKRLNIKEPKRNARTKGRAYSDRQEQLLSCPRGGEDSGRSSPDNLPRDMERGTEGGGGGDVLSAAMRRFQELVESAKKGREG